MVRAEEGTVALVNHGERVRLGRTQVEVTRLGLGLAPLGGLYTAVGDEQAYATVDRAWQLGLRYFDTAPLYGNGLSERRSGHALAGRPRPEFTLSTKVGRRLVPGGDAGQRIWAEATDLAPVWDFTAEGAVRSHAESLARLGLDRVDILHIHDPDEYFDAALAGALPALLDLRREGRIGAVSVGMNQVEMLAAFARTGDFDCFLVANRYTLLDQSALTGLLPLCARMGISVIIGGVFNSGVLADPGPHATFEYAPVPPAVLARVSAIRAVCDRHGVPLRAAALQFPCGHPSVATVLVGARSPEEVSDAVDMFSVDIPARLWQDLKDAGLLPTEAPLP